MARMEKTACALVLHEEDNVAVLLAPAVDGAPVTLLDSAYEALDSIQARADIESFHKICTREIAQGEPIVKFGEAIGRASHLIRAGEHVHVHNVVSARLSGGDA